MTPRLRFSDDDKPITTSAAPRDRRRAACRFGPVRPKLSDRGAHGARDLAELAKLFLEPIEFAEDGSANHDLDFVAAEFDPGELLKRRSLGSGH